MNNAVVNLETELRQVMEDSNRALNQVVAVWKELRLARLGRDNILVCCQREAYESGTIDGKNAEQRDIQMKAYLLSVDEIEQAEREVMEAEIAAKVAESELEARRIERGILHDLVTLYAAAMQAEAQ